jgi:hypothetical protein
MGTCSFPSRGFLGMSARLARLPLRLRYERLRSLRFEWAVAVNLREQSWDCIEGAE